MLTWAIVALAKSKVVDEQIILILAAISIFCDVIIVSIACGVISEILEKR